MIEEDVGRYVLIFGDSGIEGSTGVRPRGGRSRYCWLTRRQSSVVSGGGSSSSNA